MSSWFPITALSSLFVDNPQQKLWQALARGDVESSLQLLKSHPDLAKTATTANSIDGNGNTILHWSCTIGDLRLVQYVLSLLGNDPNLMLLAVTQDGCTAFHLACRRGNAAIVECLMETTPNAAAALCERTNTVGYTALHMASEAGHVQIVQYLVDKKRVDINAMTIVPKGHTALHLAALNGRLLVVIVLLDHIKSSTDAETATSQPKKSTQWALVALHCASAAGHAVVVKYLMDKGLVTVDSVTNGQKWTALHIASYRGRLGVVQYLVQQQKANVETKTGDGNEWTALHLAATNGSIDARHVIEYLVEQGANLDAVDSKGQTPMALAVQKGNEGVVRYLQDQRPLSAEAHTDGDSVDVEEARTTATGVPVKNTTLISLEEFERPFSTALLTTDPVQRLCRAVLRGQMTAAKMVLVEISNVDELNSRTGHTALHLASLKGHFNIVRYLVDVIKASVATESREEGNTSLHFASAKGHLDVVKYLSKSGANIDAINFVGKTALHVASAAGHVAVVKFLTAQDGFHKEAESYSGVTALQTAVSHGHLRVVTCLFESFMAGGASDATEVAQWGVNVLHRACVDGRTSIVKYLIDKSIVTTNSSTDASGWTSLHVASCNGRLGIVKYLAERRNANIEARTEDGNGWSSLHLAATCGSVDALQVVRYLVEQLGANVHAVDSKGRKPIDLAQQKQRVEVVQYLGEEWPISISVHGDSDALGVKGARSIASGTIGDTARKPISLEELDRPFSASFSQDHSLRLCHGALRGNLVVVKMILAKPLNVDDLNSETGHAALHLASRNGHLDIVKHLVEVHNANVATESLDEGNTALHYASAKGHLDVAMYLLESGASIDAVNNMGETALYLASAAGHVAIVKSLFGAYKDDLPYVGMAVLRTAALHGRLLVAAFIFEFLLANEATEAAEVDTWGLNALLCASAAGHAVIVQYLMVKGVMTAGATDRKGWTSLHIAGFHGRLGVVKYLVEQQKANAEARTEDGNDWSTLHLVAINGSTNALRVLQYLVEDQGADVHVLDCNGRTPLALARQKGRAKVVHYLEMVPQAMGGVLGVKKGRSDVGDASTDSTRKPPSFEDLERLWNDLENRPSVSFSDDPVLCLCQSVLRVDYSKIDQPLPNTVDVDTLNSETGHSVLHLVCRNGHLRIVKHLVNVLGANPATTSHWEGWTALHVASLYGNLSIVKYLAEMCGVSVEAIDHQGSTALDLASAHGHTAVVKYLAETYGFPKELTWNDGHTILHAACCGGVLDIVQYFVEKQLVPVDAIMSNGVTALHIASSYGHVDVANYILDQCGALLEARTKNGYTALHAACEHGNVKMVKWLKDSGANIDATGDNDTTPLLLACSQGHLEIVVFLVQDCGLNVKTATTDKKQTLLHAAAESGHMRVVQYLVEECSLDHCSLDIEGQTALDLARKTSKLDVVTFLEARLEGMRNKL